MPCLYLFCINSSNSWCLHKDEICQRGEQSCFFRVREECLRDQHSFHSTDDLRGHNDPYMHSQKTSIGSNQEDWFVSFDHQLMNTSHSSFGTHKYLRSPYGQRAIGQTSEGVIMKKISVAVYHNDRQLYLHSRCLQQHSVPVFIARSAPLSPLDFHFSRLFSLLVKTSYRDLLSARRWYSFDHGTRQCETFSSVCRAKRWEERNSSLSASARKRKDIIVADEIFARYSVVYCCACFQHCK